ncbi:hypothetical protein AWC38_SpisGene15540 [Stylophora pistillata]|uniref:DNA alkylation repair enzyme n=1 Tax=Stylophora pistillata TaxID=50429 RepID=A0A2B4RNL6_STYPI|nr:hypothetical protein AWC38_SpisGene15540 [Stylophora pistillata]
MSKRRASSKAGSLKKRGKVEGVDQTAGNEVKTLVDKVARELLKNADHKKSQPMKKYLRDKFEIFGLSSPLRKSVCKELLKEKLNPDDTKEFVLFLWTKPEREFQYFAIDYLEKNLESSADFEETIQCLKDLITSKSWWDTVDALASKMVGGLVKQHRDLGKVVMEEWINHENMWLRRTAILHQLSFKEETDEEMLFRFCSLRASEEEFFIRKAIGWALRHHSSGSKPGLLPELGGSNTRLKRTLEIEPIHRKMQATKFQFVMCLFSNASQIITMSYEQKSGTRSTAKCVNDIPTTF